MCRAVPGTWSPPRSLSCCYYIASPFASCPCLRRGLGNSSVLNAVASAHRGRTACSHPLVKPSRIMNILLYTIALPKCRGCIHRRLSVPDTFGLLSPQSSPGAWAGEAWSGGRTVSESRLLFIICGRNTAVSHLAGPGCLCNPQSI